MNGKKVLSLTMVALFFVSGIFASSNERGIDLYRAELYDAAKLFFLNQKNQSDQQQAENYYYLGQTYYELQQLDSAAYFYDKAVQTSPGYPFGYIGQGKLILAKDAKAADALFKKAVSSAKKDPSVQTSIAEVYINANMKPQAQDALDRARKINRKYSGIYVALGDLSMKEDKVGEACSWYENAIQFDKNDKVAYLKIAQVYANINTSEALKYLDQLITIDPDYIPAYALIGDINRSEGMYLQALRAYEKFISISGVPLLQHERYAQLLYFTDQYEKSLQQIDYVLKQDPQNSVMHRLQAYNNFKLENYALGLEQMTKFLQNNPVDRHIYLDYMTHGHLLIKSKQPELAAEAFLKAAALDPSKSEVFKELASAYEAANNYPEVVRQYEKYFEVEETPDVFSFFYYGQANYSAASKYIGADYLNATVSPEQKTIDDAAFQAFLTKGDAAFAEVISRSPESYLGYLWRARLNSFIDVKEQSVNGGVMQGAAKPFYEEVLTIMLANNEEGRRDKDIIEAYRYLASYYILLDDKATAGDYFKKILEIDSENQTAKDALDTLKIRY